VLIPIFFYVIRSLQYKEAPNSDDKVRKTIKEFLSSQYNKNILTLESYIVEIMKEQGGIIIKFLTLKKSDARERYVAHPLKM